MSRAELLAVREQLLVRDHVVHQTPVEGGAGVDEVAGGAHLLRPPDADRLRERDGQAPTGHDADPCVGVGEACPLRRHQEVAGQRDLEPAGDRGPVDRTDDGLGMGWDRRLGEGDGPRAGLALHPGGEVGEVEPGAERGVLAGEDRRVDVVVGLALRQAGADRRDQLAVERVAALGPVERDGGDAVDDVDEHDLRRGHESSCT